MDVQDGPRAEWRLPGTQRGEADADPPGLLAAARTESDIRKQAIDKALCIGGTASPGQLHALSLPASSAGWHA
jgi:hypothetical protein